MYGVDVVVGDHLGDVYVAVDGGVDDGDDIGIGAGSGDDFPIGLVGVHVVGVGVDGVAAWC